MIQLVAKNEGAKANVQRLLTEQTAHRTESENLEKLLETVKERRRAIA